MKYLQGVYQNLDGSFGVGFSIHVLDEVSLSIYTYIQELKTWNLDARAVDHYFFPELHEGKGRITFSEISREQVYQLVPLVPRYDRREETQRRLSNAARSQVRRSGKVLTSAEVGLLTKDLGQRPAAGPVTKELIEVRSQHKRWTALILYDADSPARRKAVSSLRANQHLAVNSKGEPLDAQHRWRDFTIEGQTVRLLAVEVKYLRAVDQGVAASQTTSDENSGAGAENEREGGR